MRLPRSCNSGDNAPCRSDDSEGTTVRVPQPEHVIANPAIEARTGIRCPHLQNTTLPSGIEACSSLIDAPHGPPPTSTRESPRLRTRALYDRLPELPPAFLPRSSYAFRANQPFEGSWIAGVTALAFGTDIRVPHRLALGTTAAASAEWNLAFRAIKNFRSTSAPATKAATAPWANKCPDIYDSRTSGAVDENAK